MFEPLYDTNETTKVNFIGYVSERNRFDFAIVHSDQFFGKPLVVCMQTGRSGLLCSEDAADVDLLQRTFNMADAEESSELSAFLQMRLPVLGLKEQYE